ncbi:unnamed protein product [Parajaminaea phylloscopi]
MAAQAAYGSSRPPHAAPLRRHSLFGTEDRIVLDIGSRCCKVGFSGEAQPRKIFKTVDGALRPGVEALYSSGEVESVANDEDDEALLWHLDLMRPGERHHVKQLLKARLTVLLRSIYQDHLSTDPAQRKVIVVENPFTPVVLRECLYAVLFDNLHVPSISPMPAPLLAALSVGTLTALVVSVGALETTVMPLYEGRPVLSHFASTSRAGRNLERRLRGLLLRYARFVERGDGTQPAAKRATRPNIDMLPLSVLEGILAGSCFVADQVRSSSSPTETRGEGQRSLRREQRLRGLQSTAKPTAPEDALPDWQQPHTGDNDQIARATLAMQQYDETQDPHVLKRLKRRYEAHSTAKHLIAPLTTSGLRQATPSHSSSVFPQAPSTLSKVTGSGIGAAAIAQTGNTASAETGEGDIVIPGWIRERVADFFWDEGNGEDEEGTSGTDDDDNALSLQELVLRCVSALPVDLRRPMISSILVTGGPASLPGFAHRMRCEVQAKLEAIPDDVADACPLHLQGARVATSKTRSYPHAPLKPLCDSVAVLNDHRAPLDPDSGLPTSRGGTAPAIPPLLHAWFGGSLAGSLKLSSVETTRREDWDALKLAAASASQNAKAVGDDRKETARPALGSKGGRGSFMGVVGGLDTGAFGGLAAISRHMGLSSGGR